MNKLQKMPKEEICHDSKCVQKIKKGLPPISKTTVKDEEEWQIKALPTDWRKTMFLING